MSKAELANALSTLSTYRTRNTRASFDIVEKGIFILENDGLKQMGDEGQLAVPGLAQKRIPFFHY